MDAMTGFFFFPGLVQNNVTRLIWVTEMEVTCC